MATSRYFFFIIIFSFGCVNIVDAQNDSVSRRLLNLNILADVWGKLYLLHPNVVLPERPLDWNQVLTSAIKPLESAPNDSILAERLNAYIFKPLGDPFSFATTNNEQNYSSDFVQPVAQKWGKKITYINLTSFSYCNSSSFIESYSNIMKSIPSNNTVIIDLRWDYAIDDPYLGNNIKFLPLRFFVSDTISAPCSISRQHEGWNEFNYYNVYRQKWQITYGAPLKSIHLIEPWIKTKYPKTDFSTLPVLKNKVVFLVNNTSAQFLGSHLSELMKEDRFHVIWEQTGKCSLTDNDYKTYSTTLKVQLIYPQIISYPNPPGFHPDVIVDHKLNKQELLSTIRSINKNLSPPQANSLEMHFPDYSSFHLTALTREEKLAGLFKIWIVIKYFDPNIQLASCNWNNILWEWIQRIEKTADDISYYQELEKLAALLNDSHVYLSSPLMSNTPNYTVPFRIDRFNGKAYVTSFQNDSIASKSGLTLGNEIITIDGDSIANIEKRFATSISSSTPQSLYWNIYYYNGIVRRPKNTVVNFQVKKSNRDITKLSFLTNSYPWQVVSEKERHPMISAVNDSIGYIDLTRVNTKQLDSAFILYHDMKGLILDLRGFSQSFGTFSVLLNKICSNPVYSGIMKVPVVSENTGDYSSTEVSKQDVIYPENKSVYTKPIVVLINELPQSSPEHLMIYLKNYGRVVFVGTPTSGTDGNITQISLPGNGKFVFTGMNVTYGDGALFQNIGIFPDVYSTPTIEGCLQGKDEIYLDGINVLKKMISPN